MNKLSDKYVVIIFVVTVLFIFGLVFSVKSPEREIIDQPLIWKEDLINSNYEMNNDSYFKDSINMKSYFT